MGNGEGGPQGVWQEGYLKRHIGRPLATWTMHTVPLVRTLRNFFKEFNMLDTFTEGPFAGQNRYFDQLALNKLVTMINKKLEAIGSTVRIVNISDLENHREIQSALGKAMSNDEKFWSSMENLMRESSIRRLGVEMRGFLAAIGQDAQLRTLVTNGRLNYDTFAENLARDIAHDPGLAPDCSNVETIFRKHLKPLMESMGVEEKASSKIIGRMNALVHDFFENARGVAAQLSEDLAQGAEAMSRARVPAANYAEWRKAGKWVIGAIVLYSVWKVWGWFSPPAPVRQSEPRQTYPAQRPGQRYTPPSPSPTVSISKLSAAAQTARANLTSARSRLSQANRDILDRLLGTDVSGWSQNDANALSRILVSLEVARMRDFNNAQSNYDFSYTTLNNALSSINSSRDYAQIQNKL